MLGQPVAAEIGLLVPDASAMRESISGNANVIGFLPVNSLNSSVREITLNGSDPSTLQIPILAITSAQPQGKIKEWLLCLQKVLNP